MVKKNAVHEQLTHLQEQLEHEDGPGAANMFEQTDDAALKALRTLLSALGWRGEQRHLLVALSHMGALDDSVEFRAVLARLDFETRLAKKRPAEITTDHLPCLLVTPDGKIQIILQRENDAFKLLDVAQNSTGTIKAGALKGEIYQISTLDTEAGKTLIAQYGWMGMLSRKFRPLLWQLLAITLLGNILALGVPIFIMVIYDKAIVTASTSFLVTLFAGITIILAADFCLRLVSARLLAYLGARFDAMLNLAAFQQILHLPISMTENLSVGAQVSRLKQFEAVRDIFTSPLAGAILDLPFIWIYLGAIMFLGASMVWVPVVVMIALAIMAVIAVPIMNNQAAGAGEMRARSRDFLLELAARHTSLRQAHAQSAWMARFRKIAFNASLAHFRAQQASHVVHILANALVLVAIVAALGTGAPRVLEGNMTQGALIAVIALLWRALMPLQTIFTNLAQLPQMMTSGAQANHLMQLKPEMAPGAASSLQQEFKGAVRLRNVSFRYGPHSQPALTGLSVDIPPGQLVGLAGLDGAGKSTLFNIILGLYPVQAGAVYIDGLDLRQIDPGQLRHAIALVPQNPALFNGTIEQNIRLAHPEAAMADIERALEEAGVTEAANALPLGMQTQLTPEVQHSLPDDLKQRLMLARAYVKSAAIYLLDEPASHFDQVGDQALCAKLENLRGKSTVIMATHNQHHMQLCDRLITLDNGQLIHDGTPGQVLPLITAMTKNR